MLLTYSLYKEIKTGKLQIKRKITEKEYEEKSYILYSSYYILYIVGKIAQIRERQKKNPITKEVLMDFYETSLLLIHKAVKKEKNISPNKYTNADFFKTTIYR